jgi:GAF domain-containing protein
MELTVPLGFGVSLSTVHRRIDSLVDRLVFRRQYREEVALRRFARECAFVTQPESLLDLAMDQIALHAGVPWIAMYEYTPDGYSRVRQLGTQDLPTQVAADDLALVKLRAHDPEVNLHEAPSAIGRGGYAFPLRVRGHLLGVLVVGPRPGEHSVAEERELLAHVAHEVGAALFALRAEASEARAQASEAQLRESHAREKTLLEALRAFGATASP